MASDTKQGHSLRKDFGYYMAWWLLFGALAGFTEFVDSSWVSIWQAKLHFVFWGLVFGASCGIVFTFLQNKYNRARIKPTTWGFAILTWMVMKFVFYYAAIMVNQ